MRFAYITRHLGKADQISAAANDNLTQMQVLEMHSNRVHIRAELASDDLDHNAQILLLDELRQIDTALKAHTPRARPRLHAVH